MHWTMCMIYVSVCDDTLHSCPILEIVALPVCSPSMAFSLKNRKILSSSGLSLSGIRCIPRNLGSGIHTMHQNFNFHKTERRYRRNWVVLNQHFGKFKPTEMIAHFIESLLAVPKWAETSVSPVTGGSLLPSRDRSLLQKRNVTRPPPAWAAHA